jgi:AcrR family transcriptional regulator
LQIQKNEVRNRILYAAKKEFLTKGYKDSSMRQIALTAKTTPGNIYSYFSSKDELFTKVISPVLARIQILLNMQFYQKNSVSKSDVTYITNEISDLFLSYKDEFLILLTASAGSAFENIKNELIQVVAKRFETELPAYVKTGTNDTLLCETLAVSLIEGLMNIFNKCHNDEDGLSDVLSRFLSIFFHINKK